MVCGLFLFKSVPFGAAQDGLIVVINSDTTWTKADSPYNFTGPVLVSEGATLTIEAGVTADFNYRDLRVDGTLRALGTSAEQIVFTDCMDIEFTETSVGWNEQTGSGSIIQHTHRNSTSVSTSIDSSVPLKLDHVIFSTIEVANYSILSNSKLGIVTAGSSCVISNNTLGSTVTVGSSSVVSGNNISGSVNAVQAVISHNAIRGEVDAEDSTISNNQIRNGISGSSLVITNNNVTVPYSGSGSLQTRDAAIWVGGGTSIISGNILSGGGPTYDMFGRAGLGLGAVNIVTGSVVISGNIITGEGIWLRSDCDSIIIENNSISDKIICSYYNWDMSVSNKAESFEISGNVITGQIEVITDNLSVSGNNIIGRLRFSGSGEGTASIIGNTVSGGSSAILGGDYELVVVENNFVVNTDDGISLYRSSVTIQNNTVANNTRGISLNSCTGTINYNNIENNSYSSISHGHPDDIDATYNWWGTTDTQTINMSIRDYKYNYDVGRVIFVPFLTEPNPKAMPASVPESPDLPVIPEFPSWTILPLVLALVVVITFFRKNLVKTVVR